MWHASYTRDIKHWEQWWCGRDRPSDRGELWVCTRKAPRSMYSPTCLRYCGYILCIFSRPIVFASIHVWWWMGGWYSMPVGTNDWCLWMMMMMILSGDVDLLEGEARGVCTDWNWALQKLARCQKVALIATCKRERDLIDWRWRGITMSRSLRLFCKGVWVVGGSVGKGNY